MSIFVTGGAGFIGTNFLFNWFADTNEKLINIDKLTYANNYKHIKILETKKNYLFFKGDIADNKLINFLLKKFKPRAIINFAAETHVDNSIEDPYLFMKTNVIGTQQLLNTTKEYWDKLDRKSKLKFRFIHISTDEVYGSLNKNEKPFCEKNNYNPNSPYSASKASSNLIVRAYFKTYGFPVITTNCSNNYGPYQFPEKLIPLTITNALQNKPIPIYGNGQQVRDWIHVNDHCRALTLILKNGCPGEVYNIGGSNEMTNINVVYEICQIFDQYNKNNVNKYSDLIRFVDDRLGHDQRYAVNNSKIKNDIGWVPLEDFKLGLNKTIWWYLNYLKNKNLSLRQETNFDKNRIKKSININLLKQKRKKNVSF